MCVNEIFSVDSYIIASGVGLFARTRRRIWNQLYYGRGVYYEVKICTQMILYLNLHISLLFLYMPLFMSMLWLFPSLSLSSFCIYLHISPISDTCNYFHPSQHIYCHKVRNDSPLSNGKAVFRCYENKFDSLLGMFQLTLGVP